MKKRRLLSALLTLALVIAVVPLLTVNARAASGSIGMYSWVSNLSSGDYDNYYGFFIGVKNGSITKNGNQTDWNGPDDDSFKFYSYANNHLYSKITINGSFTDFKGGTGWTEGTGYWVWEGSADEVSFGGEFTVSNISFEYQSRCMVEASGYTGVYDGQNHTISVSVKYPQYSSDYTIKYGEAAGTYDLDAAPVYSEPGTYTVYFQVTSDAYSCIPYNGSATVTINPKQTPTISVDPTASAITYGQTLGDSLLSGGKAEFGSNEIPGTFVWTTDTTAPAVSDSEVTEYEVTFVPTDTVSYYSATCEVTLAVNPKTVTAPDPSATTFTYTGSAQKYDLTVSPDADYEWVDETALTGTDAGSYTVALKLKDDTNYQWDTMPADVTLNGGNAEYTFIINKAKVTPPAALTNTFTYNGSEQKYDLQLTSSDPYELTAAGSDTKTNAGDYTVALKLKNANYEWNTVNVPTGVTLSGGNAEYIFTIGKKTVTAPAPSSTTFIYSGEAQKYDLTVAPDADYEWVDESALTRTDVGSYQAELKLKDTANCKWDEVNVPAGVTVSGANAEYIFIIAPMPTHDTDQETGNVKGITLEWTDALTKALADADPDVKLGKQISYWFSVQSASAPTGDAVTKAKKELFSTHGELSTELGWYELTLMRSVDGGAGAPVAVPAGQNLKVSFDIKELGGTLINGKDNKYGRSWALLHVNGDNVDKLEDAQVPADGKFTETVTSFSPYGVLYVDYTTVTVTIDDTAHGKVKQGTSGTQQTSYTFTMYRGEDIKDIIGLTTTTGYYLGKYTVKSGEKQNSKDYTISGKPTTYTIPSFTLDEEMIKGPVTITFRVYNPNGTPSTGDNSPLLQAAALFTLSALGLGLTLGRKKKYHI